MVEKKATARTISSREAKRGSAIIAGVVVPILEDQAPAPYVDCVLENVITNGVYYLSLGQVIFNSDGAPLHVIPTCRLRMPLNLANALNERLAEMLKANILASHSTEPKAKAN